MNIRVPGANIFIDLYRNYFGANPTAMDFSEVYTSLQQKTIDGQENPIAVFDSSKFRRGTAVCYPVGRGTGYHHLGHEPQDHEEAVP